MAGQVEFADVVVVNKVDLLPCESSLAMVQALVRRLNPRARVVATSYGKVDPQVRQAGRQAAEQPSSVRALAGPSQSVLWASVRHDRHVREPRPTQ